MPFPDRSPLPSLVGAWRLETTIPLSRASETPARVASSGSGVLCGFLAVLIMPLILLRAVDPAVAAGGIALIAACRPRASLVC